MRAYAAVREAVRWAVGLAFALAAFCVVWVALYRVFDPPVTYLVATEWARQDQIDWRWRDLEDISPHFSRAAMGGEDARFCSHWGFDFAAIRKAMAEDDRRRGASTISQQVAKNVFLWPEASWTRKGLEAGFTLLIELIWPKRRIMEVYLNVAEMGDGVFGAEAAAARWFRRPAAKLSLVQAARIVAILPNPRGRKAAPASAYIQRRARAIASGAETLRASGGASCLDP